MPRGSLGTQNCCTSFAIPDNLAQGLGRNRPRHFESAPRTTLRCKAWARSRPELYPHCSKHVCMYVCMYVYCFPPPMHYACRFLSRSYPNGNQLFFPIFLFNFFLEKRQKEFIPGPCVGTWLLNCILTLDKRKRPRKEDAPLIPCILWRLKGCEIIVGRKSV